MREEVLIKVGISEDITSELDKLLDRCEELGFGNDIYKYVVLNYEQYLYDCVSRKRNPYRRLCESAIDAGYYSWVVNLIQVVDIIKIVLDLKERNDDFSIYYCVFMAERYYHLTDDGYYNLVDMVRVSEDEQYREYINMLFSRAHKYIRSN